MNLKNNFGLPLRLQDEITGCCEIKQETQTYQNWTSDNCTAFWEKYMKHQIHPRLIRVSFINTTDIKNVLLAIHLPKSETNVIVLPNMPNISSAIATGTSK